jgi:hypothetical protein
MCRHFSMRPVALKRHPVAAGSALFATSVPRPNAHVEEGDVRSPHGPA